MGNIILPGKYGIGSQGYVPTRDGYDQAARHLISEYSAGRSVDTSNPEVRRVMDYYGASSMDNLRVKFRGW